MELPRIPKEQLSQELREVVGDNDLEFDSVVDPSDIFDISFNPHTYEQGTRDIGKKLIELREQNELHGRSSKERYKENS
tara:strand:+ start:346 stop:582 length:237 start_codon:yes stop_codon:yes gene_type:complete